MGKRDKLIQRLLGKPNDFTYEEMVSLLRGFGYNEETKGRSSGSSVMFLNNETGDKIMFHKPHPQKELKKYVLECVIEKLTTNKLI